MRRHHNKRIQKKRQRHHYWGMGLEGGRQWDRRLLGISINTAKPHSCFGCANARRSEGPTLAELRNQDMFFAELKAL